jgi:hypothetical protein
MGIPQDLDLQKRNIAQYILEQDKDIATIFFLTPKGDIYIGEPYSDQQQLPRLNYADRDWYKGVTRTNDTYVSAVFLSAAIHVPAIRRQDTCILANNADNNHHIPEISLPICCYKDCRKDYCCYLSQTFYLLLYHVYCIMMRLFTAPVEDPLSTPEPYQVFQYIGLEYFEMQQCAIGY